MMLLNQHDYNAKVIVEPQVTSVYDISDVGLDPRHPASAMCVVSVPVLAGGVCIHLPISAGQPGQKAEATGPQGLSTLHQHNSHQVTAQSHTRKPESKH